MEMDGDHVAVRATLNGREMRLVLDTGASHVLLSPEAAKSAGIRKGAKLKFSAFGDGRGSAWRGVCDSVEVGPAVAKTVPVAIMPIPSPLQGDGLLGLSFLEQFTFGLDHEQKRIWFAPRGNTNLVAGASSVPLQETAPILVVDAEVDGIPARLIVDTGGGQSLVLQSWFVEKHQLRERYPKRLDTITGIGLLGRMHAEIVRLRTLRLGDYTVTNVFAEFEPDAKSLSGPFAGVVGAPFLRRFNLTFDVAGRQLWIEPNSHYAMASLPPTSVRSGLVCLPEGADWIVQDLIADSPAAEAGVRRGDRLMAINEVPLHSLQPWEIKRAFQAAPGTRVRLRLQTGGEAHREVTLILRDLL